MKGDIRTQNKQIKFWENKYGITLTYHIESDALFVKTKIGLWKIHINIENGKYLLYHRNSYTNNQSGFHRQNDMKSADSLEKLINYIVAHDKAKEIIMEWTFYGEYLGLISYESVMGATITVPAVEVEYMELN